MRIKRISIYLIILLLLTLTGCGSSKLTSNDWEYEKDGFVYHFGKNGKGTNTIGEAEPLKFKYEDKKTYILITYEGIDTSVKLDYEISDGKLIIDDSFGNKKVYLKKIN